MSGDVDGVSEELGFEEGVDDVDGVDVLVDGVDTEVEGMAVCFPLQVSGLKSGTK